MSFKRTGKSKSLGVVRIPDRPVDVDSDSDKSESKPNDKSEPKRTQK